MSNSPVPFSHMSELDLAIAASLVESEAMAATPVESNVASPEAVPLTRGSDVRQSFGTTESDALIARMLQEESAANDADLLAIMAAFGVEEAAESDVEVRVRRDGEGRAGFGFDRGLLNITSIKPNRPELATMQVGDIMTAVNGERIADVADYTRLAHGVQEFTLTLRRTSTAQSAAGSAMPARRRHQAGGAQEWSSASPMPSEWQMAAALGLNLGLGLDEGYADVDSMSYEELLELEERQGPVVDPGLPAFAIDRLPVERVCGGGGECAICLEEFGDGEEAMRLPCLHTFHAACSREWLRRQAKCPFCNAAVSLDEA